MFYEIARRLVWLAFNIKYRIKILGKENSPRKKGIKGGYIVACNHQSFSDPPLVAAAIKGHFSFMAKSELFEKNKFFAWIISRCGAFPVVRGAGDNKAIDRAISDLKEKNRVFVIFPEGTRSKDGSVGRAKSGVAMIAGQAKSPVLPLCIKYGPKKFRQRVTIAIGEMIPAKDIEMQGDDRKELRRVSTLIMDNVRLLMEKINLLESSAENQK